MYLILFKKSEKLQFTRFRQDFLYYRDDDKKINIDAQDILPCRERIEWKEQLGATQVTLIFASSDLGNPASSFGHTFLKLVNPKNAKNRDLIDYGVNDVFYYKVPSCSWVHFLFIGILT